MPRVMPLTRRAQVMIDVGANKGYSLARFLETCGGSLRDAEPRDPLHSTVRILRAVLPTVRGDCQVVPPEQLLVTASV